MKISFNWLKDYIDIEDSPYDLAKKLTESGFEVEEVIPSVQSFSGVIVGRVDAVEKHPDADKLSLCDVFDGEAKNRVICGAPNVKKGQLVPFAKLGAVLPQGFKIKKVKIRGVESTGMICSKEELGLEKSSDGIWDLEESLPIGLDFYSHLVKQQDHILEIAITPNRPDCLSLIGIAREVSAITGKEVTLPSAPIEEDKSKSIDSHISIHIHDQEGCPRYAGRVILDVTLSSSPRWMQERLESVGIRPINNIVDITNYVLMEYGHPLHAFDLSEIKGAEIHVRKSKVNEVFITLDEKERRLPTDTVMICDEERAVALGGIMGGLNSEVSESTRNILLESAYFKPTRIAQSSRRLGMSTEASQRFERGADPNGVTVALNRAASLIHSLAGGSVVNGICDVYPQPIEPARIFFRPQRVNHLLGSDLSHKKIINILKRLQLDYKDNHIIAPTNRVDLKIEADIIEEVARLVNYSNLPSRKETTIVYDLPHQKTDQVLGFLRRMLLELGLTEVLTNSMIREKEAPYFAEGKAVNILNPISDDMTTMRPSLLPGMLKTVGYNINRHQPNLRFFEIGRIFKHDSNNSLPAQPYALCVVITGKRFVPSWNTAKEEIDFFDIKGYLESFLRKIFLDNAQIFLYDNSSFLNNKEAIAIQIDQKVVGYCGKIKDEVAGIFEIKKPVYAFHLELDELLPELMRNRIFEPIPRFPHVEMDFAILLDKNILASEVLEYIKNVGGNLLHNVEIFDIFEGGPNISAGKRSLALRLRFQSKERTLNDAEVNMIFRDLIARTTKKFNATLRK